MSGCGELLYKKDSGYCGGGCGGKGVVKTLAVILPIPGQKYTIGPSFTSREEQGELIYCKVKKKSVSENKRGHCEIYCKTSGDFSIKGLQGTKMAINRDNIRVGEEVPLMFGDEIRLTGKYYNYILHFRNHLYGVSSKSFCLSCLDLHLHKRKRLQLLQEEVSTGEGNNEDLMPGRNTLIMKTILEFLPLPDLKKARLVCKAWNEEGSKLLKSKTQLSFNLEKKGAKSLFFYEHKLKEFGHTAWKFGPPKIHFSKDAEDEDGFFHLKMDADLNWFFAEARPLTELTLDGSICSRQDFQVFLKILEKTGPSLKTVRIKWHQGYVKDAVSDLAILERIAFPLLKRLDFSIIMCEFMVEEYPEESTKWATMCQNFMKIPENLETFSLNVEGGGSEGYGENVGASCLEYLPSAKTITNLSLGGGCGWSLNLGKALLATDKLTQLTLDLSTLRGQQDASGISEFLKKHSKSLRKLCLVLPPPKNQTQIAFPSMPKLKRLQISCRKGKANPADKDVTTVGVTFPDCEGGVLIYEKNFPELVSLSVSPSPTSYRSSDVWLEDELFMRPFFSKIDEQKCHTVVELDAPYSWKSCSASPPRFTKAVDVKRLMGMFPNAKFPELEKAVGDWRKKVSALMEPLQEILNTPLDLLDLERTATDFLYNGKLYNVEAALKDLK